MARIRSVKPEFWEDEAIGCLSRDARLLYIATWNMADDEGLLRWTASYLKASAFMYDDDLTVKHVEKLMTELVTAGLVCPYIGGKARQSLAWIVQFSKHQKPNRPQPSKLPPPSIQSGDVLQAYIRRDANICHLCGHECSTDHDKQPLWPSLDHLTPRSQGGSDYPSNLRLSHTSCNKARRDRPVESFTTPARVVSLTDSLPDSVNGSLPEGLGSGGEQERTGTDVDAAGVAHIEDPTSRLLLEHNAAYPEPLTPSQLAPVRTAIAQLVGERVDPDKIRAGLARMRERNLSARLLPELVVQATAPLPSRRGTADERVAGWLDIAEKFADPTPPNAPKGITA